MKRIYFIVALYAVPAAVISYGTGQVLGFALGWGSATLLATALTIGFERKRNKMSSREHP